MQSRRLIEICTCVCVSTANRETDFCWASVQLVLSQHVEVTALVLVADLHLVVPTERNANLSQHLIVSQLSRVDLASLLPPHIQNTLFFSSCVSHYTMLFCRVQQVQRRIFLLCTDSRSVSSPQILTCCVDVLNCNSSFPPADGRKCTCAV